MITEDTALTFSSAKSFNVSSRCLIDNTMVQISSGGTITQSCIAIGVDETNHNNLIEVLPNPTSGKVNLQIPQQFGQTKTLEVFSCTGQLQLFQTSRFDEVDISILTSGIYFLVLTNAISERQTIKIIKE
ncbi:MAG: T9SS type A sorting domain-containing protein [Bacteroidota bacterium]